MIDRALNSDDEDVGRHLATFFSLRDPHVMNPALQIGPASAPATASAARRIITYAPYDILIVHHLRALSALNERRYVDAFGAQCALADTFIKEVLRKTAEENWFLPVAYRICSDLRLTARAASLTTSGSGDGGGSGTSGDAMSSGGDNFYEGATALIMECYRTCVVDVRAAPDASKRIAMLNLTNQLFRLYFKMNKLHLLKPLVRAIDNCDVAMYDSFSMADKVTYRYYTGRRAMFDSDFKRAEDSLSFAFRNCFPSESKRNHRLILMYLIPVKMFLGHMPSERLLKSYNLREFSDVADAVRQGNLKLLSAALETHETFFIRAGIFLMLEKLRVITLRTLFKRVCAILETAQVPLDAFVAAMQFMDVDDVDAAEVACLLSNLINQRQIKGYISHDHQKLVISKKTPFPPLSTVNA